MEAVTVFVFVFYIKTSDKHPMQINNWNMFFVSAFKILSKMFNKIFCTVLFCKIKVLTNFKF